MDSADSYIPRGRDRKTEWEEVRKSERERERGRNIEKQEIGREGLGERLSGKQREERERKKLK